MTYKYKEIDLSPVKERIVEQAYASVYVLNEEQKRKLIQDKFDRARVEREGLAKLSYLWHTDR